MYWLGLPSASLGSFSSVKIMLPVTAGLASLYAAVISYTVSGMTFSGSLASSLPHPTASIPTNATAANNNRLFFFIIAPPN